MSDSLRIAIVTPAIVRGDGQGRVNYEIAKRAADAGHHVTVVTNRVDPDIASHERIRVVMWNLRRIPSSLLRSQAAQILVGRWLKKHRSQFDIVHVNGSFSLAASDVNTSHFVHTAWLKSSVHTSRLRTGLAALYYRLLTTLHASQEVIAYRRASTVVAVSNQVRREIAALGIDSHRIEVIHNGVDVDEFAPGPAQREKLGLPPDAFLIMFAGDMKTPRKNLDSVLKAIVDLPSVHVVAVGSLDKNPYPAMARDLEIDSRVHFLGFRRDVAAIMQSVDAFVFPSRYEACSLVLLEALASGLPVITAATAGGSEIVAEAGGAVLDDPERVDLLAAEIRKLMDPAGRATELREASRRTALRYSWDAMVTKYLEVYQNAVSKHRG